MARKKPQPEKPEKTVAQSTMAAVAVLCLAVGFLGGVLFSVWKTGSQPGRPAPPGQSQAEVGDRSRELDALVRETAQNPTNTGAWIQLGNLYFDTDQYEKSIWAYLKALELDPDNADVWTDLGVIYRRSGRPRQAVEAFDKAIAANPQHEVSRFNKGIVLMHDLEDPQAGINAWQELLEINPLAMAPNGKSVDELVTQYQKSFGQTQP
jgi:cytochrome c-type biogenesis protein CcmH/NrfG